MPVTTTNHGLSVRTGAAEAQRLASPLAAIVTVKGKPENRHITNCFNDATSGHRYTHTSGHEGIDFACDEGNDVMAMYGGVVVEVQDRDVGDYGKFVRIQSHTNWLQNAGFEHQYAHLSTVAVKCGDVVAKGDCIGESGRTGTVDPHLHVHLKPFNAEGEVPLFLYPYYENEPEYAVGRDVAPPVATRILGCMNFACFLPADEDDVPDITPVRLNRGTGQLLSARDAYAQIPVRETPSESASRVGLVDGKYIGCYAVERMQNADNSIWYEIQWTANKKGWVSQKGDVGNHNVQWVQLETSTVVSQKRPRVVTAASTVVAESSNVRSAPSTAAAYLGTLSLNDRYAILGSFQDPDLDIAKSESCWWKIDLSQDRKFTADRGWVRSDVVIGHGDLSRLPAAWPPAPQELKAPVRGAAVVVSWEPSAVPPHMPQVTGYRVRRYGEGTGIFSGVDHQATFPWVDPTPDSETGRITYVDVAGATPYALLFYEVSALVGDTEGAHTKAYGVIFAPEENGVYVTPQGPQGSMLAVRQGPGRREEVPGFIFEQNSPRAALGYFQNKVGNLASEEWLRILQPDMNRQLWGWVPLSAVQGYGSGWRGRAQNLPRLPLLRVTSPQAVPLRTGPSFQHGATGTYLTNSGAWYEVTGQSDGWWQVRVDSRASGWLPSAQVALSEATAAVPGVTAAAAAQPAQSEGHDADGDDMGGACGQYRNLAVSWGGSWTVEKEEGERTVTAAFRSDRSPVQYLADRQMDLLELPAGLRPTRNQDIRVTGTHVHENGEYYTGRPPHTFTLRVYTSGAVRYVDHPDLDQVGYLRYAVRGVSWQTARAAQLETRPELDPLTPSGTFLNQQTNWGSYWRLDRDADDDVSGAFGSTRSPVDYHANGAGREAILLLPVEYWPDRDQRFRVRNAIRVEEDGTDSTDTRRVDFWLTVQSNGEMWYDRDASLTAAGVGFLRFTVDVDWEARFAREQVPTAPRALAAEDVADASLELDWRSPQDDGGADIEGYRIECWDGDDDEWDTEESDTDDDDTDYDVRRLAAHTRYSYRVRARNRAGWGPASAAVTATTRRQKPAAPRSVTASSRHDRVTLAWSAPSGSAPVTGYRVQRQQGSGSWSIVDPDTGSGVTHCVDRGVAAGTSYSYQVQALNYGEPGEMSSARSISTEAARTVPGKPTALGVGPGTDSQLQLTWTEPADTGGGVTGYQVERSPDALPRVWTEVVADTGTADPTYAEDELGADTLYHYRVSACNSAGAGMPSPEAAGRTRPRLRLDQPVRYPLTAQAEPRADAAVTATFPFFLPERAFDLAAQAEAGAAGWQQIQPFHTPQAGPFWVPQAAGTAQGSLAALPQVPGAPATFTATLASSQVTLSWTSPVTGDAVTGYRLWRQADGGAWTQLGSDLAATALTHTDTTVTVDQAYRYWVQALAAAGAGVPSEIQALAVMSTAAVPASVESLAGTATATALQLTWQAAATGGLPAAYQVEWRSAGNDLWQDETVPGPAPTLTDLRPGTAYEIQVTAFNQEGAAAAAAQHVSTLDAAPTPPTAVAVGVTGDAATATWQAPVAGGTAASYEVQSKTRSGVWPATTTTRTQRSHALTALTFGAAYDLRVRACNPTGDSGWVALSFTAGPERPGVVRHLAVAPGADSQLEVTWTRPADSSVVTGYRIERAMAPDPLVWSEVVADSGTTDTLWADSGLTAATVYHYRVTGRSAAGLGTPAAAATGTTRPQLTLLATATYPLTARAWPETTAPVTHTWDAHDATLKLDVVGQVSGTVGWYRGLRFGEAASGPYWLPAAAVTVTGSTTEVPAAPGTPTALAAAATHDTVTLSWTAPAMGGTVTGYRIWRQIGTAAFTVWADALLGSTLSFNDYFLTAETAYQYRLQALSTAGAGLRTAAVSITTAETPRVPGLPTALAAAPGTDSQMHLSWTAPTDAGTQPLTGYRMERAADVDPRVWEEVLVDSGTTDLTWSDGDLAADTVYHYRVSARSDAGVGDPAAAVEGRTRPQLGLLATANYPLTAYAWPELAAPVTHSWNAPDAAIRLDIVGQVPGPDGWYRGLRFGESGSGPYWLPAGAVTVTGSTTDLAAAAGVPGALAATATHDRVTLSWTAPATGGTVTGYRLWRQTGTGEMTVLGSDLAAGVLTHADRDVTLSTAYQYRLQALAAAGSSARTAAVNITTLAAPAEPGMPTGLTAAPGADSQMELAWTAAAGGSAATGFRIERSADVMPRMWVEVLADSGTPATTWADSGLDAGTVYHYRVTGRNAAGLGLPAAEATGSTRPQVRLLASTPYPVTAHAWPLATAPVTHTWSAHESPGFDLVGQGAEGGGWYRALRFGESASGPYWLPARAVTVTGSTTALAQAPGVPGDLPPPVATHDSITLSWTAPTTGGPVTGYRLWRQTGVAEFAVLGADLAAAVLTHTDSTVTASTTYQYRLQALSTAGAGVRTPAASVTTAETPRAPGRPPALTAQPTADSQMTLSWAAPADPGTQPVTGYRIERAADVLPRMWTEVVADTGHTDVTWTDSGLAAATLYHYRVSAINAVDTGDPAVAAEGNTRPQLTLLASASYPLTAHQWPAAAAAVTHTWAAHDAAVQLDLVAQGGGGGGWYRALRFGQAASGPYWLLATAVTVTGATPDLAQVPDVPGAFQTTELQGQVSLSWTAPVTGGAVTGYRLWRQTGPAAWAVLGSELAADVLSHTDTAVTAGTTYRYRLQARAAAGYGVRTAALTAAVTAPPVAPVAPAYVAVAQVAATTAQLFWDPVAGATGYEVEMWQSWYAADHAEARVRLPASGTFTLRTAADRTVAVTVLRTGTRVELTGLPASYSYWDLYVRATNAGGESAWVEIYESSAASDLAPRQPTGLRGQRSAAGTAALRWAAVAGATDYRVYFDFPEDDQGSAGWDWLPYRGVEITGTGTMATVSGLPTPPATWGLRVAARSATGTESVRSAAVAVATAETPRVPGAPTALRAAPGADSQLELAWEAPTDPGTQPITGYRIERAAAVRPRVWTEVLADSGTPATTWADSGLTADTPYHYQVSARNGVGLSDPAAEAQGTTRPQLALRVTATYPLTAHQWPLATAPVTHTWDVHDATVQLDLVAQAAGGSWWRVLRFGATAAGPYWLPAAAVTVTGATTDVPPAPGAPTALTATPGADSQMQLVWTAPAGGPAPTGYRIERSADVAPRVWTEVVADTGTPDVTWADSGLTAATVYHYRVTGRHAAELGIPTGPAAGTTRPQLTLRASATYPLTAHEWPAATAPATHTWSAHDAALTLDVMAQGAGGGGWYRGLRFGHSASGPYWLPASAVSVTGATTTLPQVPGVPGDLTPPTATHARVTLSWTAPARGGAVTGYRLWRQTGEADFTGLGPDLAADVLTHTDTTVRASTAYQYRVQALSAAGAGPRTPAVSVTTAATPRPPGPPTDLRAAPGADSPMQLSWTAPVDAGTQPVTGYRIERAADGLPRVWTEVLADSGTPDVTWSDSGLAADTVYHYRVAGRSAVGVGDPSVAAQGQTRPQLAQLATAPYPLTAHAWPAATAPATHTWSAHDAAEILDVAAQGAGGGWYRVLRFGESARGPYWLPASAVTVTGATTALPQAPGGPGDFQTTATQGLVTLSWSAPATGGPVTGYRLWRQTGEAVWSVLTAALAAGALTYTDTPVSADSTYQYRLQARTAAGYGPRTAALTALVSGLPPAPAAPAEPACTQTGATTLQLRWEAVTGASGYAVEMFESWYDTAAGAYQSRWLTLNESGSTTVATGATTAVEVTLTRTGTLATLSGLPATYSYWRLSVRATNAGGTSAGSDGCSQRVRTDRFQPLAPTGLTGTRTAAGTVALTWDAVAGATRYYAFFRFPQDDAGAAGWDYLPRRDVEVTFSGATATVSGLPPAQDPWQLRVETRNTHGQSVASLPVEVTNPDA